MVNLDYLYNPDVAKKGFNNNYFSDKKLSFQIIENGMILPHRPEKGNSWGAGGIVDNDDNYISNSFVHDGWGKSYIPSPELIQNRSDTVIYLGIFYPVWGHVITDDIRRIWFLKSDVFLREFKNCPLVYIPWRGNTLDKYLNFSRLLEIFGIDLDRLQPITQPTQFKKIIFPDDCFTYNFRFTNEYRETIDCIKNFAIKNSTPTSIKKVYYFYGRSQIGEERLAEYLKSKGYDIISPENLSLDEQLNILINCKSFASTLGSCSHNSIFLRNRTEAIFIPRASYRLTQYQKALNQVNDCEWNYIDSSLSIFANGVPRANCFIISENLKRFFGDKWSGYEEDDFKIFLQYVRKYMGEGLGINPIAKAYCGSIFLDFMEQLKRREDLITAYNMPPHWEEFRSTLTYKTHVAENGWSAWISEEEISNDIAQKFDIQAIKINFQNYKVYYSVYYNEQEGWSEEVLSPEMAGTTGKRKPIMGIRIRFDELGAKEFDILYRVHKFDGEWTDWARNGETIYSHGQQLNAIQIKLEPKN